MTEFRIKQDSTIQYSLYYYNSKNPSQGFFNVRSSNSSFTYSGIQVSAPTGCWINPQVMYSYGLDFSSNPNLNI